jgi:MerR family copper efflux transcriptional regulator
MTRTGQRPRKGAKRYQIGEIAARSHLSLRTLRYWEEVGLVEPSGRTDGGFRIYSDDELDKVMLIRSMKPADFSIDELRELVGLVSALKARDPRIDGAAQAAAVERLESFISRIRSRCELLRGRLDDAEAAAIDLERLLEAADSAD